jgi:GDP-L-fucose synthase
MKTLILGGGGLVGSSLHRNLIEDSFYSEIIAARRSDADLFDFQETKKLISSLKPDIIINSAAKVGGIVANNTNRTEFILENLKININILESLIDFPEIKLINLGSSCIYPLGANNPISEDSLMDGKLEPTNSPYAMAKLTAIEMGDALSRQFGHKITNLMPTNLYGPNDNFSNLNSHVIPGLIFRMHTAKIKKDEYFEVWGTGTPKREFLYVDDLSDAINFIIKNNHFPKVLNIGSGREVTIKELVILIKDIVGYDGKIEFDPSMPDGNPRKLLDSSKINDLGWKPTTGLKDGLITTYRWFQNN